MIDHVTLRVSDFQASKAFYETVLAPLGYEAPWSDEEQRAADWGDLSISQDDKPLTRERASRVRRAGTGPRSRSSTGSRSRPGIATTGRPGERKYHKGYYAAFVLDPDGNNVEAVFHDR